MIINIQLWKCKWVSVDIDGRNQKRSNGNKKYHSSCIYARQKINKILQDSCSWKMMTMIRTLTNEYIWSQYDKTW